MTLMYHVSNTMEKIETFTIIEVSISDNNSKIANTYFHYWSTSTGFTQQTTSGTFDTTTSP